jgi:hypothetical protein
MTGNNHLYSHLFKESTIPGRNHPNNRQPKSNYATNPGNTRLQSRPSHEELSFILINYPWKHKSLALTS